MKMITLLENTRVPGSTFITKHGLSLYIETEDQKLLFDTGPDESFVRNAQEMGVDLSAVDILVVSHAHYDHGGGLESFLQLNSKAKIFLNSKVQQPYYIQRSETVFEDIGLNQAVLKSYQDRLNYIEEKTVIAQGIILLTNTQHSGFRPKPLIIRQEDGSIGPDPCDHELIMVIEERGVLHVFTGCSHNGVTNMVMSVKKEFPAKKIQSLVGGFHLMNPPTGKMAEEEETVKDLAKTLLEYDIPQIYTGHCTGLEALEVLRGILGERIDGISTGKKVSL